MKRLWLLNLCLMTVIMVAACSSSASPVSQMEEHDESYFLISLPKESWKSQFPDLAGEINIFQTNLEGSILEPLITGLKGINYVLSLSPDRGKFLFASFQVPPRFNPNIVGDLYVFDIKTQDRIMISNNYPYYPSPIATGALWLSNDEIAFISGPLGNTNIHTIAADGKNEQPRQILSQFNTRLSPFRLIAFQEDKDIYWQNGMVNEEMSEIESFPFRSELDGENTIRLQTRDLSTLVWGIAPAGNLIAWGKEIVTNEFEIVDRLELEFEPSQFFWSPNGDRLLIKTCATRDCSAERKYYFWQQNQNPSSQLTFDSFERIHQLPIDLNIRWVVWGPSQSEVMLFFEDIEEETSPIQVLNLETFDYIDALEDIKLDPNSLPLFAQWLETELDN